jgi:hypothetical protein
MLKLRLEASNLPLSLYCRCNTENALTVLIYIRERALLAFGPRTLEQWGLRVRLPVKATMLACFCIVLYSFANIRPLNKSKLPFRGNLCVLKMFTDLKSDTPLSQLAKCLNCGGERRMEVEEHQTLCKEALLRLKYDRFRHIVLIKLKISKIT